MDLEGGQPARKVGPVDGDPPVEAAGAEEGLVQHLGPVGGPQDDVTTIEKDFWSDYELRPGVYELQYSYIDFDGATMTFTRPLIVLNRLGDVDQSGAAEGIDAGMLEQRVNSALGYEANYTDSQLFRSRVCDVKTSLVRVIMNFLN